MTEMHYLDANATQPLRPAARRCGAGGVGGRRQPVLGASVGPACPPHHGGRPRGDRRPVRRPAQDLVFTSGGTEADALAIHAHVARAAAC